jgi:hypothetical protein
MRVDRSEGGQVVGGIECRLGHHDGHERRKEAIRASEAVQIEVGRNLSVR